MSDKKVKELIEALTALTDEEKVEFLKKAGIAEEVEIADIVSKTPEEILEDMQEGAKKASNTVVGLAEGTVGFGLQIIGGTLQLALGTVNAVGNAAVGAVKGASDGIFSNLKFKVK